MTALIITAPQLNLPDVQMRAFPSDSVVLHPDRPRVYNLSGGLFAVGTRGTVYSSQFDHHRRNIGRNENILLLSPRKHTSNARYLTPEVTEALLTVGAWPTNAETVRFALEVKWVEQFQRHYSGSDADSLFRKGLLTPVQRRKMEKGLHAEAISSMLKQYANLATIKKLADLKYVKPKLSKVIEGTNDD